MESQWDKWFDGISKNHFEHVLFTHCAIDQEMRVICEAKAQPKAQDKRCKKAEERVKNLELNVFKIFLKVIKAGNKIEYLLTVICNHFKSKEQRATYY